MGLTSCCETCAPELGCVPVVVEIHNTQMLHCIRHLRIPATYHIVEPGPDGPRYMGRSYCADCMRATIRADEPLGYQPEVKA